MKIDLIDCINEAMKRISEDKPKRYVTMHHLDIFQGVLNGNMKLCNDRDATHLASWKVGGQDFYVYASYIRENIT